MSHATGIVYQGKTVIGYFEYDGTCDVACTAIQATRDEVWDIHWRKPTAYRTCTCEMHVIADVELEHDYGGGYRWESQACLTCMTTLANANLMVDITEEDVTASLYQDYRNTEAEEGGIEARN